MACELRVSPVNDWMSGCCTHVRVFAEAKVPLPCSVGSMHDSELCIVGESSAVLVSDLLEYLGECDLVQRKAGGLAAHQNQYMRSHQSPNINEHQMRDPPNIQ